MIGAIEFFGTRPISCLFLFVLFVLLPLLDIFKPSRVVTVEQTPPTVGELCFERVDRLAPGRSYHMNWRDSRDGDQVRIFAGSDAGDYMVICKVLPDGSLRVENTTKVGL